MAGEACMVGDMHDRGACVAREHVWQGAHMAGGMYGRGMCGGGHAWHEKWQLQQAIRILLEYIIVSD